MATSDKEQMGINVRQHKRMAMGEKLTGQTMQEKNPERSRTTKPAGGLSGAKKRND
jgi:hypothetical protein